MISSYTSCEKNFNQSVFGYASVNGTLVPFVGKTGPSAAPKPLPKRALSNLKDLVNFQKIVPFFVANLQVSKANNNNSLATRFFTPDLVL
jgi:hypothetical protein